MEIGTLSAIGSVLGGIGTIFGAFGGGGGGSQGQPPALAAPPAMPVPDDDAMRREKRRSLSALSQRRGRQSTILSDQTGSDLLGG